MVAIEYFRVLLLKIMKYEKVQKWQISGPLRLSATKY